MTLLVDLCQNYFWCRIIQILLNFVLTYRKLEFVICFINYF